MPARHFTHPMPCPPNGDLRAVSFTPPFSSVLSVDFNVLSLLRNMAVVYSFSMLVPHGQSPVKSKISAAACGACRHRFMSKARAEVSNGVGAQVRARRGGVSLAPSRRVLGPPRRVSARGCQVRAGVKAGGRRRGKGWGKKGRHKVGKTEGRVTFRAGTKAGTDNGDWSRAFDGRRQAGNGNAGCGNEGRAGRWRRIVIRPAQEPGRTGTAFF